MTSPSRAIRKGLVPLCAVAGLTCGAPVSRERVRTVPSAALPPTKRIELTRDGWRLIGDLQPPRAADQSRAAPAVLLLNKAAGSRGAYAGLARALAQRGIASLRLDLSAHGESVNIGRFVPGQPMPAGALPAEDIRAALAFLRVTPGIDAARLGVVGASYSGEAALAAARNGSSARVYALLSPGSLSDTSVAWLDSAGAPWFYVASRAERSAAVREATGMVVARARRADLLLLEGPVAHATDLLEQRPVLDQVLADWLVSALGPVPPDPPR